MSTLLKNPKALAALVVVAVILVVSLAGGALGNEFGGGFLGSPLAHIQIPAESVLTNEVFLGWSITNTMVATWITILVLIVLSYLGTRRMKEVPTGLQNFFEVILEFFLELSESIAGRERARRFFPLVVTIFLFIVAANWLGILPGFGTIGRIEPPHEVLIHANDLHDAALLHDIEEAEDEQKKLNIIADALRDGDGEKDLSEVTANIFSGEGSFGIISFGSLDDQITAEEIAKDGVPDGKQAGVLVPLLRSANTDINTTLAIALVAMFLVHFWGFRALGIFGHLGKFINFKQGPIGFFVGILEAISEVARIISFTFRLFGNIFAGEVLLVALAFLLPVIGIIPFLGLELFVGVIQAFIFSMLTLVFASMATVSHSSADH